MTRWGTCCLVAVLAVAATVAACGDLPGGLPASGALNCGGTEAALCRAVAEVSIAQMNLTATGPIVNVTLTPISDCAAWGHANFNSELRAATGCWEVAVTGKRFTHGGGVVGRFADGTLRTWWP